MMFVPFQQPHMVPIKPVAKRTKSACINCKAAKVGCSSERPCLWCLRHDLQDTCVDAPKKARNTRRRRNEDASSPADPNSPSSPPLSSSASVPPPSPSHAPPHSEKGGPSLSSNTAGHSKSQRGSGGPRKSSAPSAATSSSSEYAGSADHDSLDSLGSSSGVPPYTSRFSSSPSLASKHATLPVSAQGPYSQSPGYSYPHGHPQSPYNPLLVSLPSSPASSGQTSTSSILSLSTSSMSNNNMPPLNTYPPNFAPPHNFSASGGQQLQIQQQQQLQHHQLQHQQLQHQQMQQQQQLQHQQLHQQQIQQLQQHIVHQQGNGPALRSPNSLSSTSHQEAVSFINTIKTASSPPNYPLHLTGSVVHNPSMGSPSSSPHSATSTPIDIPDEEDLNGLIAERVDCNNMLIQSLLASQLTLSQLNNVPIPPGNGTGSGVHPLPPNRKNIAMYNNLIFEELAKLQQSLETISSLVQVQNFSHPDTLPTATLKVSDPMVIVVQDCNNAFAKLLGYEDCYQYLCSPYIKLESIIMPQFASFVNRRVLKMRNCPEPKLLRPTMLLTRQGELKSCFALLKNGTNGVVYFTIVKQGVIITSRCRRIMNSSPATQWEKK